MVCPELMVDGVSGQNTVLAVRHAEEGYSTEPGPALIHRKRFPSVFPSVIKASSKEADTKLFLSAYSRDVEPYFNVI